MANETEEHADKLAKALKRDDDALDYAEFDIRLEQLEAQMTHYRLGLVNITAERDRLKLINAELLAALEDIAVRASFAGLLTIESIANATIAKAEGR